MRHIKKGFSKIILLIAVVSLLAGAITLLSSSSKKGSSEDNKNRALFTRAVIDARVCFKKSSAVSAPSAGAKICSGNDKTWPTLTDEWEYGQYNVSGASSFIVTLQKDEESIKCNFQKCNI